MRFLVVALALFCFYTTFSQQRKQPSAAEIKLKLNKLNFLGSVLYVAAHPDDENTRAIAFLSNDRLAATAYLSMTRGDGGQNLIGPEIRDQLGLIRTQELLAARRIDGGEQFFTRANDFGFSKNAKETFEIWNKDEILSDVVKVIRQFQPDVILTRFPPDERAGHGHHTASAILAQEAFDLSNDATKYPAQVEDYGVWQVKRMYTNTGRVNVGGYNMLLGKSYAEIAADSRTQHKSQGFGSPGRRGDAMEFFELSRLKGTEKIQPLVDKVIAEYKYENPSASLSLLVQIRKEISALAFSVWRDRKLKEVNQLIQDCAGLYVEVVAGSYWGTPGESTTVNFEVINRSPAEVTMTGIHSDAILYDTTFSTVLKNNVPFVKKSTHSLAATLPYSSPYWLKEHHSIGLFTVNDPKMIGKPENDPAVVFNVRFVINGEAINIPAPLVYKWTDPVKGELMRPFEIVPPLFVNLTKPVYIFKNQDPQEVTVLLKATKDGVDGKIKLELPKGWKSVPTSIPIDLAKRGQEQSATFRVIASKDELNATLKAVAEINDRAYDYSLQLIEYDHIPTQTLMPKAEAEALRIDLKKEGSVVGYIRGAGDDVPASLRNMGYEVWEMKNEEVTAANLKKVDAVVLGVRTLNTNERIRFFMPQLLDYVKEGGTLVVQYNTNTDFEIEKDKFAPYPITLSRDRVTEENSVVRILKPEHPALNYPNKITPKDFDGWVQERGLYFPSNWHENYDALLSCNDTGEPAKNGSLLIANYGLGHYVYTLIGYLQIWCH